MVQKISVFSKMATRFQHILVKTWHWLSLLKSVQACDLSITDAISELLGVGHKKPPGLCLVSWGHSCLNPATCCWGTQTRRQATGRYSGRQPQLSSQTCWGDASPRTDPCHHIRKSPKPTQPPEPRDNNCFKWLSFGVICFWTTDDWDSNKEKNKKHVAESLTLWIARSGENIQMRVWQ